MRSIKIAVIGNYVPRECGIATFTRDLVESMLTDRHPRKLDVEAYVIAMNDHQNTYAYPDIVKSIIRDEPEKLIKMREKAHEYGRSPVWGQDKT